MLEVGKEGREARTFLHLMLTGEMHAGTSGKGESQKEKQVVADGGVLCIVILATRLRS